MSSAPANAPPQEKKKRGPSPLVRAYLVAYNVLSALGWSTVLYQTVTHLLSAPTSPAALAQVPNFVPPALAALYARACTTHAAVGGTVRVVQSAAALEVLHVLLGLVRSPLPTTAVQVGSRLYSVWGLAARFSSAQRTPFFASMVLSWAITEVIRYAFYAAGLLGVEPAPLLWARYSAFFVLYPTGAGSEALVARATLPPLRDIASWDTWALVRGALFVAWWPGLYPMYMHMVRQRRKIFGGQKLGGKPKTL